MSTVYTLNGKVLKNAANDKWLAKKEGLPSIPANTVRVKTTDGNPPIKDITTTYETATLVPGTTDVYDVYKSGTTFMHLLSKSTNIVEVLGANTTGITDMQYMFIGCSAVTSVPLFDTSSVTNMQFMFNGCSALTSVPLFDTSKVSTVRSAFANCMAVQSGALALYQQASSQANPPTTYSYCFYNCGIATVTGAAELAQIPSSWGGTGA